MIGLKNFAKILVRDNLHNLPKLEITIYRYNQLFDLVDCEEFKMISRPHIIIYPIGGNSIPLRLSDDNIELRYGDRKNVSDVFKAFPDV
jgi:hypothetical protein